MIFPSVKNKKGASIEAPFSKKEFVLNYLASILPLVLNPPASTL
jgi:hypothetical protein